MTYLPELRELERIWKRQNFQFNEEQQLKYDTLIALRRQRVQDFYKNGRVAKKV